MWKGMLRKLEWMEKGSSCELQGQVAKGGEQKGVHNTFLHAFFFVCFVSVVDFTPFLSMTSSSLISNASIFPITCLTLSCIIHVVLGSLLKGFSKPKNQKKKHQMFEKKLWLSFCINVHFQKRFMKATNLKIRCKNVV